MQIAVAAVCNYSVAAGHPVEVLVTVNHYLYYRPVRLSYRDRGRYCLNCPSLYCSCGKEA